jgi:tetratricopeptide (TPR) repeat protein
MTAVHDAFLSDADALRQQALQAYTSNGPAAALEPLIRAVTLDPLHADALADLAGTELALDRAEEALGHARRALVLEPEHDAGRYALACALERRGDVPQAIEALRRLVADESFRARNAELAWAAADLLAQWTGEPGAPPTLRILDPASVGFRDRFDVLAKYLYALARLGILPAWANVDPVSLYRRHIHLRTGGVEPGDEGRKASLDDFVAQFDALIDGMARNGFDLAHPVPLSAEDGLPRNGAHRLAAALAARCHVAVVAEAGPGGRWDDAWFRSNGFLLEERNALLRAWLSIKPTNAVVIVLWSAVADEWNAIEAAIDAEMPIVSRRTVELPRPGFDEMVRDMYAFDWGPRVGENIERKVALLAEHAARVRVLFAEAPADAPQGLARELKTRIRERFAGLSPIERFTTLHVSESEAESRHLAALFASANNLHWLAHRRAPRAELIERLVELREEAVRRGFSVDDCCVVGASVLDAFGLRLADDLDFTLRREPRAAHFHDGVSNLTRTLDVVSRGYPRSFTAAPAIEDDRMIDDPACHFLVRGVRFADPRIVMTRKQHQRREKDLRDVSLLSEWFECIASSSIAHVSTEVQQRAAGAAPALG